MIRTAVLLSFLIFNSAPVQANIPQEVHTINAYHFPIPEKYQSRVDFWIKVYSEYTTNHAIVHDMDDLSIVYEVVYFEGGRSSRANDRRIEEIKSKYRRILKRLENVKDASELTGEDKRVYEMVKNGFNRAARNIRAQIGQKDRFRQGLERSGAYMDRIYEIFQQYGLPRELAVLPHVESSFQVNAYSSAGAAGIWQFTRSTGRLFMRVGYDIDERRDPILATEAAAKLLKRNFSSLKSWPLAITAYNHGLQGMRNAQKRHGSEMVDIVDEYKGRTFGFASQNFYAEFLAALYVVNNKDKYFPNLKMADPLKVVSVPFDDYVHINTVMQHFNMSRDEVAEFNPALRKPVISGQKRIPRGFVFQAPAKDYPEIASLYKTIPTKHRHDDQIRSKWYTVQRGDTLSAIAMRFRTGIQELNQLNNIGSRHKIYVGQVLQLPGARGEAVSVMASVSPALEPSSNVETISYQVLENDNLSRIARQFNTNPRELALLNGIKDPDTLYPGQNIKVPQLGVVAQAIKEVSATPTVPEERKFFLKVDRTENRHKKYGREKSFGEDTHTHVTSAEMVPGLGKINRNRPAFLPVSFSSTENKISGIGLITVDFDETVSHYAEWAGVSVDKILKLNHLGNKSSLAIHSNIKIPFKAVQPDQFEEKRQEYHKAIQEDFFNNYQITKLLVRSVQKGETLWEICNDIYFIPFWLLSSYNPEKDINSLSVGEPIVVPMIQVSKEKDA